MSNELVPVLNRYFTKSNATSCNPLCAGFGVMFELSPAMLCSLIVSIHASENACAFASSSCAFMSVGLKTCPISCPIVSSKLSMWSCLTYISDAPLPYLLKLNPIIPGFHAPPVLVCMFLNCSSSQTSILMLSCGNSCPVIFSNVCSTTSFTSPMFDIIGVHGLFSVRKFSASEKCGVFGCG